MRLKIMSCLHALLVVVVLILLPATIRSEHTPPGAGSSSNSGHYHHHPQHSLSDSSSAFSYYQHQEYSTLDRPEMIAPSYYSTTTEEIQLFEPSSQSSSTEDLFFSSSFTTTHKNKHAREEGGDFVIDQMWMSDDSDDEDDDDGHSSMLSTASIRAGARMSGRMEDATCERMHAMRGGARSPVRSSRPPPRRPARVVLGLPRGGGAATQTHTLVQSEVMKKLLVSALVTLVFEGMMGHVLEFLKICMQTGNDDTTYLRVIQQITAEKGIFGLWDGFVPWGVVQAVSKGAVFGVAHALALKMLVPAAEDGKLPMALALTLAGGIGGGFQGFVLSPTLLLKTRVMTNAAFREKMSALRTTWLSFRIGYDVVMQEGLFALMKGSRVFATKRIFDWASRYYFADLFELLFLNVKDGAGLSFLEKSLASFLGGIASTCVTLPLDVLVAKTQDAKKAGMKVSPFRLFMDELDEKGVAGLQRAYLRGFEARLLHVCLTTVVIKTVSPVVYNKMFGNG